MEKANSQLMKREKLSKALLVCFIDRCLNLPVREIFHNLTILLQQNVRFSVRKKDVNRIHSVALQSRAVKQKLML